MQESYTLTVPSDGSAAAIEAVSVYGALRAMESLTQLADGTTAGNTIANAPVSIADSPRFGYRGLLVDTSRHFLPLAQLKHIVDGLAANKLNVMHWYVAFFARCKWQRRHILGSLGCF